MAVAPNTTVLPSTTAAAVTDPASSAWWPQSNVTAPLTPDGVFVFSDGLTEPFNMEPVMRVLQEATASGLLCSTINDYGG